MTRDEVMKMAFEVGLTSRFRQYDDWIEAGPSGNELMDFAILIASAERERIAKKIEKLPFGDTSQSFAVWVRQDVP